MKYKTGDRIEIINYGQPIMRGMLEGKPTWIDIQPQLVGKKAIVVECTEPQKGYERYALEIDGVGYCAWFGLKQMKKI